MKLLLFTDIHLDLWQQFSSTNANGHNTRFLQQLDVFESLLQKAEELDAYIIYAGDLWNRRLLLPTQVIHLTYELLTKYTKQTIYLILGNHDLYSWDSTDSPLSVFKSLGHVNIIDYPTIIHFQPNIKCVMVPHGGMIPHHLSHIENILTTQYAMLITHYGIHEALLGPKNIRMESDLTIKQIKELNYNLSLFGHIHKYQELTDNIIVLGSVMAHSFHEANEKKYYFIFDTETKELEKFESDAPRFIEYSISTKKELINLPLEDKNYYKIKVMSDKISHEFLSQFVKPNIVFVKTKRNTMETEVNELENKNNSPNDEVIFFFRELDTDLYKDKLIDLASNIIKEVDSE